MTTRVNLLPWREMRRKEQDRQLLTIAVGAWILMGVIIFYAHVHVIARMNVIYQLQGDRTQVVHLFDELARKLPDGVYLASLKHSASTIALQGVAQSNARVSALMRNLAASDWFTEPELEVITVKAKGSERVSEFSLKVKQAAKQRKNIEDTGT